MDLNTISAVVPLNGRADLASWKPGAAWLAGGTWLFSEPQPHLDTLLDLSNLAWPALTLDDSHLTIAATCTIAQLNAFAAPPDFRSATLIEACCRSLLGSFKIWNMATVGGNICLALPAAPMITLMVSLDGIAVIWTPDGGERTLPVLDLVLGSQHTALEPGEVLRAIAVPVRALRRRATYRQISLTPLGRSAALLVGTRDQNSFALTVTASTKRPIRIDFSEPPSTDSLASAITAAIPHALYHDDIHGKPAWRRHLTYLLAEQIRGELFEGQPT
ncbi:xanthine dehydrogenase family protein subunit M [Beijerinckia sp. L45]|uniref:FAD binding domain-containing protein n=1 Tax=Beijerinckia sp. L45 TaxID=1641855 RepID=UPI00131B8E2A|nr:FAD binding domain-containing protein [Beijerinckia sp. L45]